MATAEKVEKVAWHPLKQKIPVHQLLFASLAAYFSELPKRNIEQPGPSFPCLKTGAGWQTSEVSLAKDCIHTPPRDGYSKLYLCVIPDCVFPTPHNMQLESTYVQCQKEIKSSCLVNTSANPEL